MLLNFYVIRTKILLTDDIANLNRRLLENYEVTIVICILFASDSWFSSDLNAIFRYLNVPSSLSFIAIEYIYIPFEDNICMQRKKVGKYGIYIYGKHLQSVSIKYLKRVRSSAASLSSIDPLLIVPRY